MWEPFERNLKFAKIRVALFVSQRARVKWRNRNLSSMEKGLSLTLDIFQQTFRLMLKPSSVI